MSKKKERLLALTTPLMHGATVSQLQHLLTKKGYLARNQVDGYYGEITAQAVYRAKYWLGYAKPNHYAGKLLTSYLIGARRTTPVMAALRKKRLAAKSKPCQLTRGQKAIKKAVTQLGETEHPPNSNKSKFSLWYNLIGPWCAMFVTWVYVWIGSKVFKRGLRYAYCPFILADARAGRNNLTITKHPKSGSLVLLRFSAGRGDPEHIGLWADEDDLLEFAPVAFRAAEKIYGPVGNHTNEFWTVEGNTGSGSQANGGRVEIKKRTVSQVVAFANVGK